MAFSVEVESHGLIILSGRNGVGKSTFLKTLAGLIPALNGKVFIQSVLMNHGTTKKSSFFKTNNNFNLRSKLLAYTNTERIKEDYITVGDLIRYGRFPYLRQDPISDDSDILQATIEMLGISPIVDKYLNTVSDGEWQKANIARTLVQDTPLILMDEPSAFLDYEAKSQLFSELRSVAEKKNKLIIVSTHDLDLAKRFGHQFWHIQDGQFHQSNQSFMGV